MTTVLAVDGGGTKTHAVVADASGELLGVATGGPSNWEDVGLEAAGSTLREAVLEAMDDAAVAPAAVDGSIFGIAGIDWESDRVSLASIPESLGLGGDWEVVNDAFVALRAGANHPWGIAIIAGTGSIAAGRNRAGAEFRTLGLGPQYGDWGSASEIGESALLAVAEAYTGKGQQTALSQTLREQLEYGSVGELLEDTSRHPRALAPVAPAVLAAAEDGDAMALRIAERAGSELGSAAGAVARRLDMEAEPVEVVLAGGVFRAECRALVGALERELQRSARQAVTSRLEVPPVVGAALRAMELTGVEPTGAVHLRLSIESMRKLEYEFG